MNQFSLALAVILFQCTYPDADSFIVGTQSRVRKHFFPELLNKPEEWVHQITNYGTKIFTSTIKKEYSSYLSSVEKFVEIPKAVLTGSKKLWKTLVKKFEFDMPLEELGKTWAYQVSETGDMRVISMTMDSVDDYVNEPSPGGNDDTSEQEPVKFWLYTRKNKRNYEELNIENLTLSKYYLKRKPLMVITHGWISHGETNSTQLIKNALLKKLDVNAIIVDWRNIASKDYHVAAFSVALVGEKICELIKDMSKSNKFKLTAKHVRLVGHSLGAHVMGAAGNCLRNANFYVSRITGLDPARPFFEFPPILNGLKKEDALFVDIIHTNAAVLGVFFSRGHVDFYPNGGIGQPGCYNKFALTPIVCDHARAYHFYAESLLSDEYESTQCISYLFYKLGACQDTDRNLMGYACEDNAVGNYYLQTDDPEENYIF